jgi:hypothetical protein
LGDVFSGFSRFQSWIEIWLLAGTLGSLVLGLLATVLPLTVGLRAFRNLEF